MIWQESLLALSKQKVRKNMERTRSYRETRQLTPEKLPLRDSTVIIWRNLLQRGG